MSTPGSAKSKRRKSVGVTTPVQQPPTSPSTPATTSTSSRNCTSSLAIRYTVVEVAPRDGDFFATVWMPESSMHLASISASQIVAVSVHNGRVDDNVDYGDMENLENHWFNRVIGTIDGRVNEVGSYCVIAKAWPCRKLKDGIKLSRALAHSLGCQQPGMQVSIRPVRFSGQDCPKILNHHGTTYIEMTIHECQELVLRWFPMKSEDATADKFSSPLSAKSTPERRNLISKVNEQSPSSIKSDLPKVGSERTKQSNNFVEEKMKYPWTKDLSSILNNENTRAMLLLQRLVGRMLQGRYVLKGNFTEILACGSYYTFQVIDAKRCEGPVLISEKKNLGNLSPDCEREHSVPWTSVAEAFHIGNKTQIKFVLPALSVESDSIPSQEHEGRSKQTIDPSAYVEFSSLGGLSEQIETLKEIITFSLLQPERLTSLGLETPHGVLLYGPPGTGKTSLALASANEAGVRMFPINGPEIISEFYGESEAALQAVFAAAKEAAPSVVFIDELDAIAPQRTDGSEELGRRVVATLLTLMDGGCQSLGRVLVVATTNRVEAIDPALRRPGRFDREIEIGVPSPSGRLEILHSLLSTIKHSLTEADIYDLAAETHGFVGADLTSLCNEAAMAALRNHVQNLSPISNRTTLSESISDVELNLKQLTLTSSGKPKSLMISMGDFEEAKTRVRPSAMREVMLEVPRVQWSDIGGLDDIKQQLKEAVVWPQKHMEAFARIGTQPPRGVLLYGPPGCSKTLLARAVATEAGLNFIAVKGPELFSKWVGESEKAVRSLFQRARVAAPSVIFFDELDGLAVTRSSSSDGVSVGDRVISQLLVEMDGSSARVGVTVIAATNRPDKVDTALLRPGRFDRLLYVGPPDEAARVRIFDIHMKRIPCAPDVDKNILATRTQGYTGADIAAICRESAMAALEENLNATEVSMRHFDTALNVVQRSVSQVSEFTYLHFTRSVPFMK